MKKIVYMFPGQGVQYVGMGKAFYDYFAAGKAVFQTAAAVTGLNMEALCFESNEKINITEYTQIAILTVEAAILKVMEEKGLRPDYTAGLSLGEYGALLASHVLSYEDAFRLVRKRGLYMQQAAVTGGAMSAVLGLDAERIEEVCRQTDGIVSIANYNCPGQIVITGKTDAVAAASEELAKAGAKRIVPLNVSGPFHSPLLHGAGEQLAEELNKTKVHKILVPYVSNVTAQFVAEEDMVRGLLVRQVSSPVRWQQSMELLIAEGAEEFVEIGPGRTLSGFMKKINRDVKVYHIEKPEDLESYVNR